MSIYSLTVGDLEPEMEIDCSNQLTLLLDAIDISLKWWKPDGSDPVLVPLVLVDQPTGIVKRVWSAGDTDLSGIHQGRVIVTTSGDKQATYPDDGSYITWVIFPS